MASGALCQRCVGGQRPEVYARFTYTPDGLPNTIRASNLLTDEQLTEYVYGGSFDGLPLSTLVQRGTDPQGRLTKFTYSRQRETIWRTDANGTTHYFTYDSGEKRGRGSLCCRKRSEWLCQSHAQATASSN
jgi:YD repeat-containing protein